MGGVIGLGFGALVALCAAFWLVKRWRAGRLRPLCPSCTRWHKDTCSVPQRPDVTQCPLYTPDSPLGPIQQTEEGTPYIDWDWEDGV